MKWFWRIFWAVVVLVVIWLVVSNLFVKHYVTGYRYDWNQRISVAIDTSDGPVEASSVQAMEVRYYPDGLILGGTERSYDLTGEAVVADLGKGRYLFVLIGSDELAERAYWELMGEGKRKRGDLLKAIRRQRDKGPRPIPRRYWPQMVTFEDINDPKSVRAVDPDNLAATFGEGYALTRLTIEATKDPVTEGQVEQVLGWVDDTKYRKNPIWASLDNLTQKTIAGLKIPAGGQSQ